MYNIHAHKSPAYFEYPSMYSQWNILTSNFGRKAMDVYDFDIHTHKLRRNNFKMKLAASYF